MRNHLANRVVNCRVLQKVVGLWCGVTMVVPFHSAVAAPPSSNADTSAPIAKLQSAAELMQQANFAAALLLYDAAVKDAPTDETPYLARGWALACVGENNRAIDDLSKAIALAPGDADAYQRRGTILMATGAAAKALGDFDTYVKLRPNDATGYRDRALAQAENKNLDASLADFKQAISLTPKDAGLLVARAGVLGRAGKIAPAMADYDAAVTQQPGDAALLMARARAAATFGKQPDVAIADLKRIIALGHDSQEVQTLLGDAYRLKGDGPGLAIQNGNVALMKDDPAEALKCFQIAASTSPPVIFGQSSPHKVEALIGTGRARRAMGEKIVVQDELETNQEQRGDFNDSMDALNAALDLEPKNAVALMELGWTYYRLEDVSDADLYLKQAIKADPKLALAHLRLGASNLYKFKWNKKRNLKPNDAAGRFFEGGTLEGTESELLTAIACDPTLSDAYGLLGQMHQVNSNDRRAIESYDAAIKQNPSDDNAYMNRGLCNMRLRRLEIAVADANRAVSIAPTKATSYWYRGIILRAAGQESQACMDFARAKKLDNSYDDPRADELASSGAGLTTMQKWAIGIGGAIVFGAMVEGLLSGSHGHGGGGAPASASGGTTTCATCSGTGRVRCFTCGGSGRVSQAANSNMSQVCPSCMGTGGSSCGWCMGTGYIR